MRLPEPLVVVPDLSALRGSRQGQRLVPIVGTHNVPGLPFCQVEIVMEPGKVTKPHVHDEIHVAVKLEVCDDDGVLTLYGDHFERVKWLYRGETLHMPPGIKHMAIRPRRTVEPVAAAAHNLAYACETRSTGDWRHDVRELPEDWPHVVNTLRGLDLLDRVTWPADVAFPE